MLSLQDRNAIARRAGELSKIGARRYAAENKLLLYPDLTSNHSVAMGHSSVRKEFRSELSRNLEDIKTEFMTVANLPIENWIT